MSHTVYVQSIWGMLVPVDGVDLKDKMSRALGAAYLGHQVAKLESQINSTDSPAYSPANSPRGRGRGPRGGGRVWTPERSGPRPRKRSFTLHPVPAEPGSEPQRASTPSSGQAASAPKEKPIMANVIVLDASVLVHALGQVKRWCKDERKETLIVPLEVLNSLDLLKKGTSPLAIHARAASRFLEAQVGTNPRIHVQRDEDFCPWDDVYSEAAATAMTSASSPDDSLPPEDRAPEWMRQTICCTLWEMRPSQPGNSGSPLRPQPARIALAVVKPLLNPPTDIQMVASAAATTAPDLSSSPPSNSTAPYESDATSMAIIRHSLRATGDLIRVWAPFFGIKVLNIEQGASEHGYSGSHHQRNGHTSDGKIHHAGGGKRSENHRRNRSSEDPSGSINSRGNLVEKVRNGVDSKSIVVAPGAAAAAIGVPPGVNKIRLLTRGEKLEP